MPTTIPPDPGLPRQPLPRQPITLPRPRAEPPVPDIDPTLPSWSRGIIAIIKTLFSQTIVAQILILGGLVTNLVGLFIVHNNQTETHHQLDATKTELKADVDTAKTELKADVGAVKVHQEANTAKIDSIKGDTKKLNTGIREGKGEE